MDDDLDFFIKDSFSRRFCHTVEMAIRFKFPNIKNLEVDMDETGTCSIIFDETEYTQEEVTNFIEEFKKLK